MNTHRPGHRREIGIFQIDAGLDEARGLHLQRDKAQHAVVEDHDLHRKLHLRQRDQIAHQHGESAVTGHRDHLPLRLRRLGADRMRHRIGHRAVDPGTDQPPAAIQFQIARRPDRRRTDIGGEDRVFRGLLAEQPRQILRMNRLVAGGALRELVEAGAGSLIVSAAGIKKLAVALCLQFRQ